MSTCTFNDNDNHSAMENDRRPKNIPDHPRSIGDTPINHTTPLNRVPCNTPSSSLSGTAEVETSRCSNSTVRTTPLRFLPPRRNDGLGHDNVTSFLQLLQRTDLPTRCVEYFAHLAQSIGSISTGLVPSVNGRYRINNTYFTDLCKTLLRNISPPPEVIAEQLHQIAHLKSLILFRVVPSDQAIWSCYRQRSQMIIRLLALPSVAERELVHRLARLYNVIVYTPLQILIDQNRIESPAKLLLNQLYDTFFDWLGKYRRWCHAMKDLAERYMRPLTKRILASAVVMAEIQQCQKDKSNAQAAIDNPTVLGLLPMEDETILKALNLSAGRNWVGATKVKTRFRREKTI